METSNGLAGFLRARRELLKPADVGLPGSERRRVEGLRREEVAMLAGISTEYYLRLEQGRDHQPSEQVLDGSWRARCRVGAGAQSKKDSSPRCKISLTAGH